MTAYAAPKVSRIGSFQALTKSLGRAPYRDIFNAPALFVIYV